jgi:SprT protein
MLLFEQLELTLHPPQQFSAFVGGAPRPSDASKPAATPLNRVFRSGRDFELEARALEILRSLGDNRLSRKVHVEWNGRLRSAAGRADSRRASISLNPRLRDHSAAEIDRTLRHELAHLVAQSRAGRRRILPHGPEWRMACRDLGIVGERACHQLPFPVRLRARRFLYRCPNCGGDFPRVRRIHRATACLGCCRRHNRGRFDARFQLRLVENGRMG